MDKKRIELMKVLFEGGEVSVTSERITGNTLIDGRAEISYIMLKFIVDWIIEKEEKKNAIDKELLSILGSDLPVSELVKKITNLVREV
jgi:hypothetical protein